MSIDFGDKEISWIIRRYDTSAGVDKVFLFELIFEYIEWKSWYFLTGKFLKLGEADKELWAKM